MTFPDQLAALRQRATKGVWYLLGQPWLPSDCKTSILAGSPDPHVAKYVCDFEMMGDDDSQEDRTWEDAEYITFLANHSEAIEKVVRAAEAVVKRWDTPKWKDEKSTAEFIYALRDALNELERRKG